jgi:hypothetical protein
VFPRDKNRKKDCLFSVARRAFIEAKYVQKAFVRPLPSANQVRSSTRTIKRWSVMKSTISNDNDDETSKRQLLSRFVFNSFEIYLFDCHKT